MPAKKKDTGSFEEALHRLENIVQRLEQGDVPLEDALKLYEEGIALSKVCGEKLAQAELRLKRLGKDAEGNLKLFEGDEAE